MDYIVVKHCNWKQS